MDSLMDHGQQNDRPGTASQCRGSDGIEIWYLFSRIKDTCLTTCPIAELHCNPEGLPDSSRGSERKRRPPEKALEGAAPRRGARNRFSARNAAGTKTAIASFPRPPTARGAESGANLNGSFDFAEVASRSGTPPGCKFPCLFSGGLALGPPPPP